VVHIRDEPGLSKGHHINHIMHGRHGKGQMRLRKEDN
jgi:hypothetical protein